MKIIKIIDGNYKKIEVTAGATIVQELTTNDLIKSLITKGILKSGDIKL